AMGCSFLEILSELEPGLTAGSSRIICLHTNDRIRMNWPVNRIREWRYEQFQPGERAERPPLDRHAVLLHHHARSLVPLPQRRVHHDRAEGRRASAAPRL